MLTARPRQRPGHWNKSTMQYKQHWELTHAGVPKPCAAAALLRTSYRGSAVPEGSSGGCKPSSKDQTALLQSQTFPFLLFSPRNLDHLWAEGERTGPICNWPGLGSEMTMLKTISHGQVWVFLLRAKMKAMCWGEFNYRKKYFDMQFLNFSVLITPINFSCNLFYAWKGLSHPDSSSPV